MKDKKKKNRLWSGAFKLKGKRKRRYSHFCKSYELDQFMSGLKVINRKIIIN